MLNNSTVPGDIFIAGSQIDTQGGGILLMRFIINTTIGLFGIFDIADELGIKSLDKRFSDTLAIYGFPSGDYIVLPLLGPSSIRGAFDLPTDIALNANFWNPEVLPLSYANFSKNGFFIPFKQISQFLALHYFPSKPLMLELISYQSLMISIQILSIYITHTGICICSTINIKESKGLNSLSGDILPKQIQEQ